MVLGNYSVGTVHPPGNVQIVVGQGLAPADWCGLVPLFRRQQATALPVERVCAESRALSVFHITP